MTSLGLKAAGSARVAAAAMPRVLVDLVRYGLVSAAALAVDWGTLIALTATGLPYLAASALSFSFGMIVAYALSVRFVFPTRRALSREAEAGGFFAVGIVGLVLTQGLLYAFVSKLGLPVALAKAPTAIVVFLFNFLCRRGLVFVGADRSRSDAAASATTALWIARAGDVCLGAAIAVAALLSHPFSGVTGDAQLYIGRALADIDPDHLGRDLMFRLDGQSGFTLFRPVARWLVALCGPEAATWLLSVGGLAAYCVAIVACVRTFTQGRAMAIVLAAALLLPRSYSPFDLIKAGEALAVPRPWAEAFVLLAIACLAARRTKAAFVLVALSAALHPIIALPGAVLLLCMVFADRQRWRLASLCGVAAVAIVAASAALGVPLVSRLFVRIDPTWLGILRERNAYLFLGTWDLDAWSKIAVQAATIVVAARLVPPFWGRLFRGSLVVAGLGCLASCVGVDWLSSLLLTQIQLWRSLWLPAALAPIAAGICLVALPRDGWRRGAVLATFAAAWSAPLLAPANAMMALVAVALATWDVPRAGDRIYKAACIAAAALIALAIVVNARLVLAFLSVLPADMRMSAAGLWQWSMAAFFAIAIVSACATTTKVSARFCATFLFLAVLVILGVQRYDDRAAAKVDLDRLVLKPDLVALLAPHPGEVLWLGDGSLWSWARRPQWNDKLQGSGLVFSRDLAVTWHDRASALVALGLADARQLAPWRADVEPAKPVYDRPAIAALCRRADAPAWIVMPIEDGRPLPSDPGLKIWESRLDERTIVVAGGRLVVRSASRRLLIPCAAKPS